MHARRFAARARGEGEGHARLNVVFMGMGEPLNNEAAVLSALDAMCDPAGFALAPKGVTVSTVPTRARAPR